MVNRVAAGGLQVRQYFHRYRRRVTSRRYNSYDRSTAIVSLPAEIAPEMTGHGLPLNKCGAYNRVYEQPYDLTIVADRLANADRVICQTE